MAMVTALPVATSLSSGFSEPALRSHPEVSCKHPPSCTIRTCRAQHADMLCRLSKDLGNLPMCERRNIWGNPCLRCGACCATYRVSFYWAEAEQHGLPDSLIEKVSPWHACMAGTGQPEPRCHALAGVIGQSVSCRVYSQRPSPCRELQPGEDKCNRARARHGLPLLDDEETPTAA